MTFSWPPQIAERFPRDVFKRPPATVDVPPWASFSQPPRIDERDPLAVYRLTIEESDP